MIPILNLTRQYQQLQPELEAAILRVTRSGGYILGPEVEAFEHAMADYLGENVHAVGCANGSDALFLALKAAGIGPGDEVITSPFTYIATSESIVRAGATPVFVDIDPVTYNLDTRRVAEAITPRTRALMPVHIFGQPLDCAPLQALCQQHDLVLIEDCAQALGASVNGQKVGTFGDFGCFSFFPSKNLGAFGDGGLVVARQAEHADALRMLRMHGSRQRYFHERAGINSRLDALQAAILSVKLPHLTDWNNRRRAIAARYNQLLDDLPLQLPVIHPEAVFHQYTVRLSSALAPQRELILKGLADAGVLTMIYYPIPLYQQPTHAALGIDPAGFPVCEAVSAQVFSLPMFPELTEAEQDTVAQALKVALTARV